MDPLALLVAKRFATETRHICWYRVSTVIKPRDISSVFLTAAWIPNPNTPMYLDVKGNKIMRPQISPEFFHKLEHTAKELVGLAMREAKELGLRASLDYGIPVAEMLREYHSVSDSTMSEYHNFVSVRCSIPPGPGVKKLILLLVGKWEALSKLFEGFMNVRAEK